MASASTAAIISREAFDIAKRIDGKIQLLEQWLLLAAKNNKEDFFRVDIGVDGGKNHHLVFVSKNRAIECVQDELNACRAALDEIAVIK